MLVMDSDEETRGGSSQIFCLSWVKRDAAQIIPDKILISQDELKQCMAKSEDAASSDKSDTDDELEAETNKDDNDDDLDDLKEFDLENYDDDEDEKKEKGLSDLVVFASNDEDPYLVKKDENSDESETEIEEKAAMYLQRDDNMLVCGRCERDCSLLEVHVYNETAKDFYVHHDILLPSAPLCMEWLDFDAGSDADVDKGNFIAIGCIDSTIDVWDLDVINTMEPAFVLGLPQRKQRKTSLSRDLYHTGAVMDLAWNSLLRNTLASSSADHTVALWDLRAGRKEREFVDHSEKVQTIEWKPRDTSCLLSGACDGRVIALDTRSSTPSGGTARWKLAGEVERLAWNSTRSSYFAVSNDAGLIYYCDVRKPKKALYSWQAHELAIPALRCSGDAVYSSSSDNWLKIWRLSQDSEEPQLVHEKDLKMGMIHCFDVNPNVPNLLAIGGEKGGVRLLNVQSEIKDSNFLANFKVEEELDSSRPDDAASSNDVIKKKKKKRRKIENAATVEAASNKKDDVTPSFGLAAGEKKKRKKKKRKELTEQSGKVAAKSDLNSNYGDAKAPTRPGSVHSKRKEHVDAINRKTGKAAKRVKKQQKLLEVLAFE